MFTVNLCSIEARDSVIPNINPLSLAIEFAKAHPQSVVRVSTGPCQNDRAEIDSELLAQDGLAVF